MILTLVTYRMFIGTFINEGREHNIRPLLKTQPLHGIRSMIMIS